ncbi:mitochondrial import receptor subunit TOM40B isoform X2 [Nothobranchius furzeri]|uniref:mitochondrial import receptor subunit TOM40B isoform X2 n=1 Tax=Nothobranchius furzeri TaxID=105023 RepID=UPI002404746C|nr:mitochondrial import receptor subunit TOM40B isoform X2 [Nothobranchius furzeri]
MWNLCLIGDSIPSLTEECSASVQQPTKKRRTFGQGEQQLGAEVNHSVLLSSSGDSSYRCGAAFIGSMQTGPAEVFPVVLGDMDHSGSRNAQIIRLMPVGW